MSHFYLRICLGIVAVAMLGACKRHQAPQAQRPSRAGTAETEASPASDPVLEKRKAELEDVPPLTDGKVYTTPDGEIWVKYPNGLMLHQLTHLDGVGPQLGQKVAIACKVYLPDRFSPVDTHDDEHPVIFEFGSKKQLKGLNQGISKMHKQERYRIYVPAELAYGAAGNPELGIGPNQPLILEVQMLNISGEGVGPLVPEFEKVRPMGPAETKPSATLPAEATPASKP